MNLYKRMADYRGPGLSMSIIENGEILKSDCFGCLEAGSGKPVKSNSIFNACSISKFATSLLAMKMVGNGDLNLDENVNDKLQSWNIPDNSFTHYNPVTLRSLLCHQSGIRDPINSFEILQPESLSEPPSMVEVLQGNSRYCSMPIEVQAEPWSEFIYSDAGYCIIQLLIEEAARTPFQQVMKELIFEPLQMRNSTFPPEEFLSILSCGHNRKGEKLGHPQYPYPAACGLWSTPKDLALLVMELMRALKGESKLGISTDLAREIVTPQGKRDWAGLGIFLDGAGKELKLTSLGWGVGFQCMISAWPFKQMAAVIMTNAELGVPQKEGLIGEIYEDLLINNFI